MNNSFDTANQNGSVTGVTLVEADKLMRELGEYYFADVREEMEYITGHAREAMLFPLKTINGESAAEMIPNKELPVFVYCRSGVRSKAAADILSSLGYQVYDMGSLAGWHDMEY